MLMDNYSSFAYCFLLQSKDKTYTAVKQFLELVNNQHNKVVKQFCSDQGGEFKSKKFDELLASKGIVRQSSTPHIHQQNGWAECLNDTILGKSESMHMHAECPQSWWEFSFQTAVHVYNRTPLRWTNWKTPYENIFGKNQMYNTLKYLDVSHGFTNPKRFIKIRKQIDLNLWPLLVIK